ncbi:protein DDC8 homolog [Equus przewalskii]|uniref:TIMP metallopeptidase inhibitor 2 n=2 Tax=Equus TaxID=9789 RepID=A0A5F5PI33_HORSE|nr:protein DDC8 homolog [Equus caballus]XP_014593723.1 protein DDC8 homolog [Equus caballus]
MKRNTQSAAQPSPSPDGEALLLRRKHRLLQVREKGDLALQRRQDLKWWKSQQLQCLAEELGAEWEGVPSRQVRGLERLYLGHLLGLGGGQTKDRGLHLELLAQRGAASPPRAGDRHRAAVREEKSRREELMRQQPCHSRPPRKAVGVEKQGTTKAMGLTHPPPSPPGKHKGERAPPTKTGGGRRAVDPRVSRGLDVETLLAVAGETKHLEDREKDVSREGRRQLGKGTARLLQDLRDSSVTESPEGRAGDLEQWWPPGSPRGPGAAPQAAPCECREKSRWKRELEVAFEELFNTNRKLKKHLSLYLEPRPGVGQHPREEQGFSEMQGQRGETQREKQSIHAETEMVPAGDSVSPAEVDAHHASSKTNLEKLLSKLENQKYRLMAKPAFKSESRLSSSEAGTPSSEARPLPCTTGPRQEAPRPDTLVEGSLEGQAGRVGLVASRQKQKLEMEQTRQKQLELLEPTGPPKMSLEAHSQAVLEDERRAQARACLACLKSHSSRDQEEEGGDEPGATSALAASTADDDRHSQMIRGLEQQILEQNQSHKQFLEEARKRLQEFQRIC